MGKATEVDVLRWRESTLWRLGEVGEEWGRCVERRGRRARRFVSREEGVWDVRPNLIVL